MDIHAATGLVFMSDAKHNAVYIATVWGQEYSIKRKRYKFYDSYVYAVCQSQALVREAVEENGHWDEHDEEDTRNEIDKAVDKGICCTGIVFRKIQAADGTDLYIGSLTSESKGRVANFSNNARIRLSRVETSADARWSAGIKIKHVSNNQFTVDSKEKVPEDILHGYWRIDLMPNEQALHNGLMAIKIVTEAEGKAWHTLTILNPLTLPMNQEEKKKLLEVDAPNQDLQQWLGDFARQRGMNGQQVNVLFPWPR